MKQPAPPPATSGLIPNTSPSVTRPSEKVSAATSQMTTRDGFAENHGPHGPRVHSLGTVAGSFMEGGTLAPDLLCVNQSAVGRRGAWDRWLLAVREGAAGGSGVRGGA